MKFEPLKHDSPSIEYLQMPRFIWEMDGLSMNAKNVYMLIYNRIRQSAGKDRFTTQDGRLFCYFNDEELAGNLGLKKRAVINAVNELKDKNLLFRERTKKRDGRSITFLAAQFGSAPECTTKSSLCTRMHNQSAPECTTKSSLCTRMHNQSAPECTTKVHQNAQPKCTRMHNPFLI